MKKAHLLTAFAAIALALTSFPTAAMADTIPDEQWTVPTPADVTTTPYTGFTADGVHSTAPAQIADSYLLGVESDGTTKNVSRVTAKHWCTSVQDSTCSKASVFTYSAAFGLCSSKVTTGCISGIEAINSSGKSLKINQAKPVSGGTYFPYAGDPTIGLPGGGAVPVVEIPDAPNPGGIQYMVAVHGEGSYVRGKSAFETNSLTAQIYAVKMGPALAPQIADKLVPSTEVKGGEILGTRYGGSNLPAGTSCIFYSINEKICPESYPLPLDLTFKVTIKTTGYVEGWFHGRVADASVNFTLADVAGVKNMKEATIAFSGKPVVVASFAAWAKTAELPPDIAAYYASHPRTGGAVFGSSGNRVSVLTAEPNYNQDSIDLMNLWLSHFDNKATAEPTAWIFSSMDVANGQADPGRAADQQQQGQQGGPQQGGGTPPAGGPSQGGGPKGGPQQGGGTPPAGGPSQGGAPQQGQGGAPQQGGPQQGGGTPPAGGPSQGGAPQQGQGGGGKNPAQCFQASGGSLIGVVATNATEYISGPPTYDSTAETLDYKVTAPHYSKTGQTLQGVYTLQIADTLAQCLYGFTKAAINATISIIAADGTSKVATSLVNDTGGFLRLTSAGFTYDSLTIKVKLFQAAKAAVPATKAPDTSTPAAPKAPAKPGATKTITCVKGGLSKKVTGGKPACPAGYKQK
jgi:hypothetical protein